MPCTVSAQELVPRGYWPTPNGTNVLVLSYQRSTGDIVTDPTLPYADGKTSGLLHGELRSRELTGLGDARARLSYNLKGAPSMDVAGFQALRDSPKTIVGASLVIQAPSGEYEADFGHLWTRIFMWVAGHALASKSRRICSAAQESARRWFIP